MRVLAFLLLLGLVCSRWGHQLLDAECRPDFHDFQTELCTAVTGLHSAKCMPHSLATALAPAAEPPCPVR